MFLASPVKRDKNYEIRLLWYFSILYIRHINDQLFLFLSYFFVCFPTLFLLFLKLQSYFYPTFLHMPARKPDTGRQVLCEKMAAFYMAQSRDIQRRN